MFQKSTHVHFQKIQKKKRFLENLWDFLRRQTPSKLGGRKSSFTTAALSLFPEMGKSLILNENEALNLIAEN